MMKMKTRLNGTQVATLFLAGFSCLSAFALPPVVEPRAATPAPFKPQVQDPQELERVLNSSDSAQAVRLLSHMGCGPPNAASVEVVERAWQRRESASPDSTTRDPVVTAWMAKCLAERWPQFSSRQPGDEPVVAKLREAIVSNNPEEVRAAAAGLTHIATAEDVQAIVAVPTRLPALGRLMAVELSQICRADAADGIVKILETVADARERASMDSFAKGLAPVRRLNCRFDVNIVGNPVSAADREDFWVPPHGPGAGATAQEVTAALGSSNIDSARKVLWELRCLPSEQAGIAAVRTAWQTEGSTPSGPVGRDPSVRTEMAMCLAEAAAASHSTFDPSIATELRKAVKDSDDRYLMPAMEGLSRIATAADVQLIVDVVKQRRTFFSDIAVFDLRTTCAPGAAEAADQIRERVKDLQVRDRIDYQIKSTERVREGICGKDGN